MQRRFQENETPIEVAFVKPLNLAIISNLIAKLAEEMENFLVVEEGKWESIRKPLVAVIALATFSFTFLLLLFYRI